MGLLVDHYPRNLVEIHHFKISYSAFVLKLLIVYARVVDRPWSLLRHLFTELREKYAAKINEHIKYTESVS